MTKNQFRRLVRTLACLSALACSPAFAETAHDTSARKDDSAQNSVNLVQVIADIPPGTSWLRLRGAICLTRVLNEVWTAGRAPQNLSTYAPAFQRELERAGYKVLTSGDNLFGQEAGAADLQVAAVITDEQIDGCVANINADRTIGDVRGDSAMKIDWQIYSPIKERVVAHISTSASAHLDNSVPGGVTRLIIESFASNVRELATNADFRAAVSAPKAITKGFVLPDQQNKIVLAGA